MIIAAAVVIIINIYDGELLQSDIDSVQNWNGMILMLVKLISYPLCIKLWVLI
jgi:hypothetical protein